MMVLNKDYAVALHQGKVETAAPFCRRLDPGQTSLAKNQEFLLHSKNREQISQSAFPGMGGQEWVGSENFTFTKVILEAFPCCQ